MGDHIDCRMMDCIKPMLITFAITVTVIIIIHVFIYFKLVKIAETKFKNSETIEKFDFYRGVQR